MNLVCTLNFRWFSLRKNTKINRQKFDDYRDLLQDHSEEKDIERV